MSRVMCIWLPDWAIQYRQQAAVQSDRQQRPEALVLYDVDPRRGPGVTACSSTALRAGVRVGSPLADARALLDHYLQSQQATVRVEPHNAQQDRERLRQLAYRLHAFSPVVGLEEEEQPECLLLDITGCAHLFDGEHGLSSRLIWELYSQGLFAQLATADTVGTAWALAHAGLHPHNHNSGNQSVRNRSAVGLNTAAIIESGDEAQALAELPVETLRLSSKVIERLHEFDLRQIQQLESLPRSTLPSRFGQRLLERLDQAYGRVPETILAEQLPISVRSHWLFEEPTASLAGITFVLEHLLEEMVHQAQQHRHGLLQLEFRVHQEDQTVHRIHIGLASPSTSLKHLKDLLAVHRERLHFQAAIERIEAQALQTVPIHQRQRRLFDDGASTDEQHQQLTAFIDRLSNRLGASRVVRPRLLPDHQPEKAIGWQPLIAHAPPRKSGTVMLSDAWYPLDQLPPRPILLDPAPHPLDVQTGQPPFHHPCSLRYGNDWQTVQCCWGPERIETGWWRGEMVRRDYYRIELTSGRQLWLFHQPDNSLWFHHGAFD